MFSALSTGMIRLSKKKSVWNEWVRSIVGDAQFFFQELDVESNIPAPAPARCDPAFEVSVYETEVVDGGRLGS